MGYWTVKKASGRAGLLRVNTRQCPTPGTYGRMNSSCASQRLGSHYQAKHMHVTGGRGLFYSCALF